MLFFFSRGFHNGRWTPYSPRCAALWKYSRAAALSVPWAPLPSAPAGEQPAPPVPPRAALLCAPVLLPLPQRSSPKQSPASLPRHQPPQGLPPASCASSAALPSAVQPAAPGQRAAGCPPAREAPSAWAGAAAALGAGERVREGGKALPGPAAAPGLCWGVPRGSAGSLEPPTGSSADISSGSAAGPCPEDKIQPCAAATPAAAATGVPPGRARREHPQAGHPAEPGHHAPPAGAGGDEEGSGASPAGPGAVQLAAEPSQATSARSADYSWSDQLHSEAARPSTAASPR